MKFRIKHEIEGRIRIEAVQNRMTFEQADTLQYYLDDLPFVKSASVQERTQSVTVCYDGDREQVLEALKAFSYEDVFSEFRQKTQPGILGEAREPCHMARDTGVFHTVSDKRHHHSCKIREVHKTRHHDSG